MEFTTSSVCKALSNDFAQQLNRTLLTKARAMLAEARMSEVFWREAIIHAAYLNYQTISPTLRKRTPREALLSDAPRNSKLWVSGSGANDFRQVDTRVSESGSRAENVVYFSSREEIFRINIPSSRAVTTPKHAISDEKKFPEFSEQQLGAGRKGTRCK